MYRSYKQYFKLRSIWISMRREKNRVLRATKSEQFRAIGTCAMHYLSKQIQMKYQPLYIQLQLHLGNYLWYFSTFLVKFSDSRRNHVPRTMQRTNSSSEHQMKCGEMVKRSWKNAFWNIIKVSNSITNLISE